MASGTELIRKIKEEIREVDPREVRDAVQNGNGRGPLLVDVREQHEFEESHIPGAVHVPRGHLESRIEGAAGDKSQSIVLYCAQGNRSALAAHTLEQLLGYQDVASMTGGITLWKDRGYAVETPRALSAEQTINSLNPDVKVVKYQTRLDASNIMEIIEGYDVIVDGVDNFPTRYLLNDASVRLKIPVVSASILGFDGQLSVFAPYEGPCYRCLYPTPPPAELAPSCGANGVLGVLPGVMGLLQAVEVVKLVTGAGEPLIGRLLLYEALAATFTELKVRRDPDCPICSREPESISEEEMGVFPDYEAFCAGAG